MPPSTGGARVLCYHLVGAGTGSPVDVSRNEFLRQLDLLAGSARLVSLAAIVTEAQLAGPGRRPSVALTFDDAFRNFAEVAWPILHERGIPATLFVPTGFLDGESAGPLGAAEGLPPVSWAWLREAAASGGLAVGSHSRTHRDLRRLDPSTLAEEIGGSRTELEDRLATPVDVFCYPRAQRNRAVEAEVRKHYSRAVIGGGRVIRQGAVDPHRLSRTSVRGDRFPIRDWLVSRVWLEEAVADTVRQLR